MNILRVLFGKKTETENQSNLNNTEDNEKESCNGVGSKEDTEKIVADDKNDTDEKNVADGNKSETTRDDIQNVYHLIVVDESGSMSCIRKQTVDGCNETISHIKMLQEKSEGIQRHYLSLYFFFGGGMRYIRKNQPIDKVNLITPADYNPCSNTPLYDALGFTLNDLEYIMKKSSGKPLGYVTVITDGYENSSHRFGLNDIRRLVDRMKESGVVFSFIGANIDVDKVADDLNIGNATQFNQTDEGTRNMWKDEMLCKERYIAKSMYFDYCRASGCDDFDFSEDDWRRSENAGDLTRKRMNNENRVTPSSVQAFKDNDIFVFFTDNLGHHDTPSGRLALKYFGAKVGQTEELQGRSYAIPVDSTAGESNARRKMFISIQTFMRFAKEHQELNFCVWSYDTDRLRIDPMQMASMFFGASKLPNVKLPKMFSDYLY